MPQAQARGDLPNPTTDPVTKKELSVPYYLTSNNYSSYKNACCVGRNPESINSSFAGNLGNVWNYFQRTAVIKNVRELTVVPIKLLKLRAVAEKWDRNNVQRARILFALKRGILRSKKMFRQKYFQVLPKRLPDNYFKNKRLKNSTDINPYQKKQ